MNNEYLYACQTQMKNLPLKLNFINNIYEIYVKKEITKRKKKGNFKCLLNSLIFMKT